MGYTQVALEDKILDRYPESRYPRASPWHFFTEQASLDLNPGFPAIVHI
jgi:hypothetical protein